MNLLCQGESRFRVFRFTGKNPYWKANVDLFDDDPADDDRVRLLHEEVSSLYTKAFEIGIKLNAVASSELRLPQSSLELSFMISYVLDIPSDTKQRLLEMKSTEERLSELVGHVEDVIRKLEQQLRQKTVLNKVRGNGDLGKPGTEASGG